MRKKLTGYEEKPEYEGEEVVNDEEKAVSGDRYETAHLKGY